ncbi:S41 family peptidase [Glaciecola petra]|uniref:S41 family peptidase n=1 Tax=Glaciecola petra TaxID=3075602 RepID=A0ABU2ZU38_9ALTE|nr:S41 family peptidase [Aestuariibacter sp. P117]MDT0596146.1 S41 family peptidase [Aestuariibacter sp. P117]
MHLRLLLCGFILVVSSQVIASENYTNDVTLLKNALETAHPGYNRYISNSELASRWTELEQVVADKPSELEFYTAVSKLLVSLRCEHTKAEFSPKLEKQKRQSFMPFRFRIFDNRMFVEYADSETDLKKGDEIIAINGYPIQRIISQLSPYVERDGYTDHTTVSLLEQNFDLLGSSFEQFFSSAVLQQDTFANEFNILVKKLGADQTTNTSMAAISFDDWIKLSKQPYRLNFKDAVNVEINDTTAVLKVDTFVNYRQPIDAFELFEKVFAEFDNKGITELVVDLRSNGGGSDDAQMALLRHLYQVPFTLVNGAWLSSKPLGPLAEKLSSWDRTAVDIDKTKLPLIDYGRAIPLQALGINAQQQQPAKYAFKGEVVLLTSKKNASASAALLSHIQQQTNVTLVGDATGGNQGGTTATVIAFLTLPESQIVVRVPLIRNRYTIENALDGLGAYPDIYASEQLNDFLSGRDVAMETALSLFEQAK